MSKGTMSSSWNNDDMCEVALECFGVDEDDVCRLDRNDEEIVVVASLLDETVIVSVVVVVVDEGVGSC